MRHKFASTDGESTEISVSSLSPESATSITRDEKVFNFLGREEVMGDFQPVAGEELEI